MDLNLKEIEKLSELQCTDSEIAAWFGVSVKTIENKRKEPAYAEAMERGKGKGRISLRRLQMNAAKSGNTALLIFLGKTILGMREQVEVIERPTAVRYGWVRAAKPAQTEAEQPVVEAAADITSPEKLQ